MKKIKLFIGVVAVTSLLGITSFAAVSTLQNGAKTIDSADIVVPINENAAILDDHIDNVADSKTLGHIKIGDGLEMTGDLSDVANVKIGTGLQMTDGAVSAKIANDLETNDSETALSAAMGVELNKSITNLLNNVQFKDLGYVNLDTVDYDLNFVGYTQIEGSSMQYSCLQFSSAGFVTQILSANSSTDYSLEIRTAYQPTNWYDIPWNTIK